MSDDLAHRLERFASGYYQPATFLERGVAVPFTTPLLQGARLRPAERKGFELVIANPGGGRGFYVVPWTALPDICAPSLHDRRAWTVLADQASVTPTAVRDAARTVALEGYAGRAAAAAAAAACQDAPREAMRVNFLLLLQLIRDTEDPAEALPPPAQDDPVRLKARAKRAIARVAPALGVAPDIVAAWLEGLAATMAEVGLPGDATPGRLRRRFAEIRAMTRELAAWAKATPAAEETRADTVVIEVAELTLACCAAILQQIDAELADLPRLLRRWRDDSAALRTLAGRPDWLLDGWTLICALWRDAEPEARLAACWEMAMMVPVVPREAGVWSGIEAEWERSVTLRRSVRMVAALEDWRTGRIHSLLARNERLLARAA